MPIYPIINNVQHWRQKLTFSNLILAESYIYIRDTCPKKFHAVHFLLLPILSVAVHWFTIIIIPGLVFAVRWCSVMELVWCAAAAAG